MCEKFSCACSKSSVDKGRRVIFLSEYRRLISYMYAYDNGMKNKNVGFAKTECRGESVKLWINLKGAYSQVENYKVYFFVRHDAAIVGIYMGDMVVKSGMGQFYVSKPLSDIEEPFNDICGLYIDGKSGERMFASQWDDLPFDTKNVIKKEEYTKKFTEVTMEDYIRKSANATMKDYTEKAADANMEGHAQKVVNAEMDNIVNDNNLPVSDKPLTEVLSEKAMSADVVGDDASKSRAAATAEAPVWERPIKMVYIADGADGDTQVVSGDGGKETAKDGSVLHVSEDAPVAKTRSKMDMLFDGKEPVLAFSEDEIYDCVDIGLDELPKISAADSGLINNSFVNHGYFNFHHLLLGKKDGNILVVGVPGVYNRREKVTANMFGFEKFKFSMRSDVCMNHFGYWYKEYQYQ